MIIIGFIGGCMNESDKSQSADFNLEDYKWENRVVILYAESKENEDYMAFKVKWDANKADVNERELILVEVFGNREGFICSNELSYNSVESLTRRFNFGIKPFEVVLIGKDGTVKLKEGKSDPREIFDLIDTMPMRQDEMEAKSVE